MAIKISKKSRVSKVAVRRWPLKAIMRVWRKWLSG